MKTLHLVLKGKWYDKIASGEKTSEYRACTPYWNKRLQITHLSDIDISCIVSADSYRFVCSYNTVVFHKGYTATTTEFNIAGLYLLKNTPNDLGLDKCWEIKLGERLK